MLRRLVGWQLVLILALSIGISALYTIVSQPNVALAADTLSATWFKTSNTQCADGKSQATADLVVTTSEKQRLTFSCYSISGSTQTEQQMLLQADAAMVCDGKTDAQPTIIQIGDPGVGFQDDKKAAIQSGTFTTSNCINIFPTNTYNTATAAPTIGSATWVNENPGQISATFTLGSYTSPHTETFDELTPADDNVMTLTGSAGDPSCDTADTISVGSNNPQDNITYMTAKTVTVTTYTSVGESVDELHCSALTASLNLTNGTYGDNGGQQESTSTTDTGQTDCPVSGGWGLGWLLCPLFELARGTIGLLNSQIQNFLFVDTNTIFGTDTTPSPFQQPYDTFRNLGLTLLIIAGLVMVISEASGLDIFSAHTIRKALPRIVLAAIGIALAWPLLEFIIVFFNDIGSWIATIILAAANVSSGGSTFTGAGGGLAFVAASAVDLALVGVAGAAAAIIGAISLLGALSLVGTLALGLLLAAFVLVIRQVVVIVCILLAPLAIASAILPGTERIWKFWRDTLIGALVMFPIVMAFLAAGGAVSSIAGEAAKQHPANLGYPIISLLAVFAPYFMIPFAFRMGTGLVGNVFGMVNDRGKGAFDRLRNFRQKKSAENWQGFLAGRRFAGNNRLTGAVNQFGRRTGAFATTEDKVGYLLPGQRGTRNRREALSRHDNMVMAEWAKQPGTQATQFYDDMLWAQTYRNAAEARQNLTNRWVERDALGNIVNTDAARARTQARVDTALSAARAQGGWGRSQQVYATQQLAATGTGYSGMADMLGTITRVSGNNRSEINSLVGSMRSISERAGRNDLKAGFGDMTTVAARIAELNGYRANDHDTAAAADQVRDLIIDASRGVDNAGLLRNKTKSVENITKALNQGLDAARARLATNPNDAQALTMVGQIRAKLENIRTAGTFGYGPEGNIEAYANVLSETPAAQKSPGNAATPVAPLPTPVTGARQSYAQNLADTAGRIGPRNTNAPVYGPMPQERATQEYEEQRMSRYDPTGTAGPGAPGAPPAAPPPAPPSDRRLKMNIRHIQTLSSGIKLYSFKYIWGGPTYVGVMAQEILMSHPEAVLVDQAGFYRVDYQKLGLQMITLEE